MGSRVKWTLAVMFANSAGVVPIASFLCGRRDR